MTAPVNLSEFEQFAKDKLPQMTFDYYVSGANDEVTLHENREAFSRIKFLPHVLRDISTRDISTNLLGQQLPTPLFIAPMASQRLAHPDGELAMVRGAGAKGVGMVLSTMSTQTVEDVIANSSATCWFQLYVYKNREMSEALVRRAEAAGFTALVLTVDTPLLGRRERDVRNNYAPPPGYEPVNLPRMEMPEGVGTDSGFARFMREKFRSDDMTWGSIAWLQSITNLPIFVKGILRADDAQRALDAGVAGIIVSNHGGRQLDTVPATIECLPDVVQAVAGAVPIMMDGGIRRGTDVLKAIALGASAVLVGRPLVWALTWDGQAGVEYALDLLLNEIDLAMALLGCASLADVTPDLIRR